MTRSIRGTTDEATLHDHDTRRSNDRPAADAATPTPARAPGRAARPQVPGRSGPLPDGVRADMERAFGHSFATVRVHEGDEAAAVGARAYARGDELFFAPGELRPDTEEGRRLIGHELVHVVQQRQGRTGGAELEAEADVLGVRAARGEHVVVPGGPAAASGGSGGGGAMIQKKVGFEYEIASVGSAQVLPRGVDEQAAYQHELERARAGKVLKTTFTDDTTTQPRDYLGTGELVDLRTGVPGVGNARFLALTKKDKIYLGDGFALEADEGNAVRGMHGAFSNIEFVTDAFEESPEGIAQLIRASEDIVRICAQIQAAGNARASGGRAYMHAAELGAGGVTGKVIFPARDVSGELQVNIGLRLDRVATLMRAMAKSGAEPLNEEARLAPGRQVMGSGIDGANTPSEFGRAPDAARGAIDRYAQAGARAAEHDFPTTFGGPALEGFVALVVAYLHNAAGAQIGYAKTIAPLMARTSFAKLFALLPPAEQAYLQAHAQALAAIVADASGLDLTRDMFPHGIYNSALTQGTGQQNALAGLTRATWVDGMSQGIDFLTARTFNQGVKPPWDPAYTTPKPDLESLGALGTKTEQVGGGVEGGIFEMRSLGGLSGKVRYAQLADRLADLYVYIVALNRAAQPGQVTYQPT